MNEIEQSDLEKETNYSHSTCQQNAICCKEKENAFIKNCKCVFLNYLCYKTRETCDRDPFSRTTEDNKGLKAKLNL